MQIGDSLYINLEIVGSKETDFLTYSDVMDLKIVETAGASLPYVYMSFLCRNEQVKNSILEGNPLKVTIGNNLSNADTFEVDIIPPQPDQNPSGTGWVVEFAGFIGNKAYMTGQENEAYLGNSLLVVDKVLQDYLGKPKSSKRYVQTDFTRVNEDQIFWRKNNQTASAFVVDTLLHCDVRPSFPLFTFDKYKNFYVKDLSKAIEAGEAWTFSAAPKDSKAIRYFNNFNVESFKNEYNLYSGYNKVTEIYNSVSGLSETIIDENKPILAATSQAEESYGGNVVQMNSIQGPNVHKNYKAAYAYNTNKLMALSSLLGCLVLLGDYHKELKPLDLVKVDVSASEDPTIGGLYLIDTIVTEADFASGGIRTLVYVSRDNKNNVENYVVNQESRLKNALTILRNFKNDLLASVYSLKVAYAMGQQFFDGTYMSKVLSFAVQTKTNLLRSFSIAGVTIDFNSKANLLTSLIATGNSLMNTLVSMVFPEEIAYALWDFILIKPSAIGLISQYASEYIPFEVRDIFMLLAESIYETTDTLNSIAKDNGIKVDGSTGGTTVAENIDKTAENQQKVNTIISDFENNTTGLDVPFPIINLTESESLLPEEELRDLIANKTIDNLTDLNYLENVDKDKFKDILLGKEVIDFNIINEINRNAGNVYSYRFWGTYKDLAALDSFTVKKGYKDKYRTLPCTKLISALDDKRIFFACPSSEEKVKFYINSKRAELQSFDTDLGYTDIYGNKIIYKVYYTETGYNSNSVMLEVKQGGMV